MQIIEGTQKRVRVEETPDIVYRYYSNHKGTLTPLKMSLLTPLTDVKKPVIVFFPGGGFTESNYHKYIQIKMALAERGFVVASAEYRVIPEGFPGALYDAKAAIAYLKQHSERYKINPCKIGVFGQSAGGYMSQLIGTTSGTEDFLPDGITRDNVSVQAVVSLFGISDLLTMGKGIDKNGVHSLPTSTEAIWLNGFSFTENHNIAAPDEPQKALAASPIHYVTEGLPPFLLLHGDHDPSVSPHQVTEMQIELEKNNVPVDSVLVKGAGHGTVEWIQPEIIDYITNWFEEKLH